MPNLDEKQIKHTSTGAHNKAPSVSASTSKPTSSVPKAPTNPAPKPTAARQTAPRATIATPRQATASHSDSTIAARQAPIVPKSTLSETAKPTAETTKKQQKINQRLKSSNISMDDLETINEQNLKQYRSRVTRNRFLIITLIILLIAAVATFAIVLSLNKMVNNCQIYIHGDASAEAVIDGQKMSEFRTPIGIQGNRVYMIDTDVEISSSGNYNIYFTIEAYQAGIKLKNTFAYDYNHDLFHATEDGRYVSNNAISGGQTIDLFRGVVLDDAYENTLTTDNFSMKINIYFTKV